MALAEESEPISEKPSKTLSNRSPAAETQTSFPEQAVYYYIRQRCPDAVTGDRGTIGMELDIFIPSLRAAIEYDGYSWHNPSQTDHHRRDLKKNQVCEASGILLIRVREYGLDPLPGCLNVMRGWNNSGQDLNEAIQNVFLLLGLPWHDVDVEHDSARIQRLYMHTEKEDSLLNRFPEIAHEWSWHKNGGLTPGKVAWNSERAVWWQCEKGHEWVESIRQRTDEKHPSLCPYCSGRRGYRGNG